jgi:SWI/SNF-related matrix-associated actin-dependent regulator of chromatin subfamily A3
VQNKLDDIGALFVFVRALGIPNLAVFRKWISMPFDESEESKELAKEKLSCLLDSLCLRRTKDLLNLPNLIDCPRKVNFSAAERHQYDKTLRNMDRKLREMAGEVQADNHFG